MDSYGLAIVFAIFAWWFSTGAILLVVRLPRRLHGPAMGAFAAAAGLALWGLVATRQTETPAGALAGFTYGLIIWGFLEASFLLGYVTGPRREPQSRGAQGVTRFREAFDTLSFHEFAILAAGIVMIGVSAGALNAVGTWTFLTLWSMRISAKLNLFFGAPNVSVEFLPQHLDYLASYFHRGAVSLFFTFSVTLASLLLGGMVHASATAATAFQATADTLVAALLALAILEHWFLVLPLPDAALWRWALKGPVAAPSLDVPAAPAANDAGPRPSVTTPPVAVRPGVPASSTSILPFSTRSPS